MINYLHYGNSLKELSKIDFESLDYSSKIELSEILKKARVSIHTLDVIKAYGSEYKDSINLKQLANDIELSVQHQLFFDNLKCRGFSYDVVFDFDCSIQLCDSINFKIALITKKGYYYPPRLRRYLPRPHKNHVRIDKFPSIAFALGKIVKNELYVYNIQSDLVFNGPACIRDYLRGWRKVLFYEILNFCSMEINNLYLSPSSYLLDAAHPELFKPKKTPNIWYDIYDKTAIEFDMEIVDLPKKINIQTIRGLDKVEIKKMYHKKV